MNVRIEITNTTASGRRRGWTKLVTSVDKSKTNGYAFEGEFLNEGLHEVPIGSTLVQKNPEGSVKNGYSVGRVGVVCVDGSVNWREEEPDWYKEFLLIRDMVCEALGQELAEATGLSAISDDELLAECRRRGLLGSEKQSS